MMRIGRLGVLGTGVVLVALAAGATGGDETASAEAGAAGASDDIGVARGRVTSVTLSRLTVERDGRDWTFAITGDTDVLARGVARAVKAWGTTPITAFVQTGDTVSVIYRDVGGALMASQVRFKIVNP